MSWLVILSEAKDVRSSRKRPLTRPATADENAVAAHPLPKGEGFSIRVLLRGVGRGPRRGGLDLLDGVPHARLPLFRRVIANALQAYYAA